MYIGQYVYNVHSDGKGIEKRDSDEWITVENHHEPILNEDVFCRMKFLLTRNKRGGVPSHKTYVRKNIHVFAGLLRCGQCGSNMTANLDRRRANGFRPSNTPAAVGGAKEPPAPTSTSPTPRSARSS